MLLGDHLPRTLHFLYHPERCLDYIFINTRTVMAPKTYQSWPRCYDLLTSKLLGASCLRSTKRVKLSAKFRRHRDRPNFLLREGRCDRRQRCGIPASISVELDPGALGVKHLIILRHCTSTFSLSSCRSDRSKHGLMRLNTFSLLGRSVERTPWTCARCRSTQIRVEAHREYSRLRQAQPVRLVRDQRRVNKIFLAVATLGVGGGAYLLRDDIRHWYHAAARSGRVVSTLYVCIQEYVLPHPCSQGPQLTITVTEQR